VAAEPHQPVAVDEDGAVVPDRMGVEDALQQRLAEDAVQAVSPREMPVQRIVSLNHDQRADLFVRQVGGGLRENLHALVECRRREKPFPEPAQQGQALEKAPEVLLKDDDENEQNDCKEGLEDDGGQIELEEAGEAVDDSEQRDAPENEAGGAVLEPDQKRGDHDRDDDDVQDVLNPDGVEHRQDGFGHGGIRSFARVSGGRFVRKFKKPRETNTLASYNQKALNVSRN